VVAQVCVDGSGNGSHENVIDGGPSETAYTFDLLDLSRPGPDRPFVDTWLTRDRRLRVTTQQQLVRDLPGCPAELQHLHYPGRVGQLGGQGDGVKAVPQCLRARVPQHPGRAHEASRVL